MKKIISLIIPCLNEEEAIPIFIKEVEKTAKKMKEVGFEYIFVDDGSTDKTLNVLRRLSEKKKEVKYISFTRNYGKEAAMYAGLKECRGDFAAILDVDLQDPPEKLIEMKKILEEKKIDCVALYTKSHEGYSIFRKKNTSIWYKISSKLLKSKQMPGARDYRLMTRKMVESILSLEEYNRYTKGIFDYVGFETEWIPYEAPKRKVGKSKFNTRKLIKYAVEGIISSSTAPLVLATYIGLFFCIVSFVMIFFIIIRTLIHGDPVQGWPSMACIVLFVSGIQLFFLGVIGTYVSKIYLEVKNRPLYIIKEQSKK